VWCGVVVALILEAESVRLLLQSRSGLFHSDIQHIPQEGKTSSKIAFILANKRNANRQILLLHTKKVPKGI
jgi:hypothetical protein